VETDQISAQQRFKNLIAVQKRFVDITGRKVGVHREPDLSVDVLLPQIKGYQQHVSIVNPK
jgi:hypothetical protein